MTPRIPVAKPEQPWSRYQPSAEAPWDLRRVVHLHRRAGFSATWAEIRRDLKEGPEASVDRVLAGTSRLGGVPDEFESTSNLLADAAVISGDANRLRAWWVYRLLGSPDPLGERLTLIWHNHFASAASKVENLGAIRRQNETFRRLARAPFGELLNASIREPALLVYLDAPGNVKGQPNENLGRELLELFTLGLGQFGEADVKDAARALTGWSVEEGAFVNKPSKHDPGEKTILGQTGTWTGADLLNQLIDQPGTSRTVARRICELLMGEPAVADPAVALLAADLESNHRDVGQTVATVLRSVAFFDSKNIGTRVVGPVEFVIGACRALIPPGATPSTLLLADWITRLGQELFEPPNVGGWPGGRAWLNSRTLVARANFATALVGGHAVGLPGPLETGSIEDASALLLGVGSGRRPPKVLAPEAARSAIATVLASPEAQLG